MRRLPFPGYYGGYYPQAYQYYPRYGYDMMNYASGKTTNTTLHTSNGNKKLNAAYNEAAGDKSSCPVFLIFSVSEIWQKFGCFDLMAECWQQDKWVGCFPVKCHIPVTNSRDTQEVKELFIFQQSFTASDKKATPKDKSKKTSVIAEVAEEISQNGVAEVASTC
ncbi:unnamed protein product [Brassica napus]|uniref:YTH domain-containing family protein n=1 Tax=Brassica napus TaxID=3708 RepID=A0A816K5S9_BRANA|nr:unnamed protein product [Brassica napus]